MAIIYAIRNTKNTKVYVGMTRRSLEERWKDHNRAQRKKFRNNMPL